MKKLAPTGSSKHIKIFSSSDYWYIGNDEQEAKRIAAEKKSYVSNSNISEKTEYTADVKAATYRVPK